MTSMPQRELGSTGERVSLIGLGGAHIGRVESQRQALNLIDAAIDGGITFMDNSWDYHNGASEERLGLALKGRRREELFVMTKVDGRSRQSAQRQLDQSLRRLQLDSVDLLQIHEVIRWDDPDRIFAPGGAIEALAEARRQGKVRYLGFTGHKHPDMLLKMLEQDFVWDAVQLPLNVLDAQFRSFEQQVLPLLNERGIGVLAMKPFCGSELFETEAIGPIEALHYVMNLPVDVVINGIETERDLDQALRAASSFKGLSKREVKKLLGRVKPYSLHGDYEGYKTTHLFDGTSWHPEWLEAA